MTAKDLRPLIASGSEHLGVSLNSFQLDQLVEYLALLKKWNKAYNLTAIRDETEMVSLHILDSLAIVPKIQSADTAAQNYIDVGTGAGLPGLVLAIVFPNSRVTLLDSNGKKCRFLTQVKAELGFSQVSIVNDRVENHSPEERYDGIFSRAFATLKDMTDNAAHLLEKNGSFWAMKGLYPRDEIAALDERFEVKTVSALAVPNLAADRHLIEISMS